MNRLAAIRAAYGLVELAVPRQVGRVMGLQLDRRAELAARVLGARQLAQAGASGWAPTAALLALGAEVDLLHAASMIGVAALDRRRRRAALTSATTALGFAVAGTLAARRARDRPCGGTRRDVGVLLRRDQLADRIARHLVPVSLRDPDRRRPDRPLADVGAS